MQGAEDNNKFPWGYSQGRGQLGIQGGSLQPYLPVHWVLLASLVPLVSRVPHENLLSPSISVFEYNDTQVGVLNQNTDTGVPSLNRLENPLIFPKFFASNMH